MTRVSLKEAYDNKDIVAQIYAIRDTAESAVDTSEQAVTTANTASDHVDALVPQVEQAVENANQASASAQASAQTVAGYENRLTVAEGAIDELESDVNDVTLRVTTAEGDIVTIQGRITAVESKNTQQDTAISALQTADGQNVKINRINDYAVGLTGNQTKAGQLSLTSSLILKAYQAELIEFTGGPRIGTNETATQCILRQMRNPDNENYIVRDTVYQSAGTKNISRIWYLQRENDDGTGLMSASLSLSFNSQTGRATLSISDSAGTRTII